MKCKQIFDNALRLIGCAADPELVSDYAERMPYLIACFVGECYAMDATWRERQAAAGKEAPPEVFEHVCIEADEDFPMSARFSPAAAYYIASMLVLEENDDLADVLYSRYCDALSHIRAGVPMTVTPVKNKYSYGA